jgi:hypothetical protein
MIDHGKVAGYLTKKALESLGSTKPSHISPRDAKELLRIAQDISAPVDDVHDGLFINDLFKDGNIGEGGGE